MHYGHGIDSGSWWWIPMVVMMVVFWGGLIVLAVTLLKRPSRPAPPSPTSIAGRPSAHEILAERLARGEIDLDDYQARRDALDTMTK